MFCPTWHKHATLATSELKTVKNLTFFSQTALQWCLPRCQRANAALLFRMVFDIPQFPNSKCGGLMGVLGPCVVGVCTHSQVGIIRGIWYETTSGASKRGKKTNSCWWNLAFWEILSKPWLFLGLFFEPEEISGLGFAPGRCERFPPGLRARSDCVQIYWGSSSRGNIGDHHRLQLWITLCNYLMKSWIINLD